MTEVNVLGVAEHKNLVKLVGYCAEDDERGIQRLLVYEYMPNRSVENHLSARSETPLSWAMRLKIAQDAARGLAYLHEEMVVQVLFPLSYLHLYKGVNCVTSKDFIALMPFVLLAQTVNVLSQLSSRILMSLFFYIVDYLQRFQIFKHSLGRTVECKVVRLWIG